MLKLEPFRQETHGTFDKLKYVKHIFHQISIIYTSFVSWSLTVSETSQIQHLKKRKLPEIFEVCHRNLIVDLFSIALMAYKSFCTDIIIPCKIKIKMKQNERVQTKNSLDTSFNKSLSSNKVRISNQLQCLMGTKQFVLGLETDNWKWSKIKVEFLVFYLVNIILYIVKRNN